MELWWSTTGSHVLYTHGRLADTKSVYIVYSPQYRALQNTFV